MADLARARKDLETQAGATLNILEQRTITPLVVVEGEPDRAAGQIHLHGL